MVLILTLPSGLRRIVDLPLGQTPESIADQNGAALFDLCESEAEAWQRIASDPTGKADSC